MKPETGTIKPLGRSYHGEALATSPHSRRCFVLSSFYTFPRLPVHSFYPLTSSRPERVRYPASCDSMPIPVAFRQRYCYYAFAELAVIFAYLKLSGLRRSQRYYQCPH